MNAKLQRLVNNGIRFIFNLRKDDHITPYRVRLGWLTVADRRLFFLGVALYQVLLTSSPVYLRELFIERDPSIRQSSRLPQSGRSSSFQIPSHRSPDVGVSQVATLSRSRLCTFGAAYPPLSSQLLLWRFFKFGFAVTC